MTALLGLTPYRVVGAVGLLAFAWFAAVFLVYPNVAVIGATLTSENGGVTTVVSELFASERVREALRDTLVIAVVSTFTANLVGIAQALLLEAFHLPGRRVLSIAYAIPLVFGSVTAVSGYVLIYGSNGVVTTVLTTLFPALDPNWFQGMGAVIFVHTFTMTGFHFLFLRPAIRRVDFSLVEAARALGMGPIRALWQVVLPVLRPVLVSAIVLTFVSSVSSFAAPQILGGRDLTTIAPLIQSLLGLGRADMAAVLGLLMGLSTIALLWWALRQERRAATMVGGKSARPFARIELRSVIARTGVAVAAWALAAVNLAPLLVTVLMSLTPVSAIRRGVLSWELTTENYAQMLTLQSAAQPLVNSLTLSAIAIPAGLLIAWFAAHLSYRLRRTRAGELIQLTVFLPHFLPGVLIALGLIIAFGSASPLIGGQVLVGTYIILPLAYIIGMLPVMTRFLRASYAGLDPSLEEASRSLGAGPARTFLVALFPVLVPVAIQAAALSLNDSLGEYTVSVMLYNVNNQPVGVALGTLAASQNPDNAGLLSAYATTITLASLALVVVADRFAERASARYGGLR